MKQITVLGSTGSIGTQSLDVCRNAGYPVYALCAHKNIGLLRQQIEEFHPQYAVVIDEAAALQLKAVLQGQKTQVLSGYNAMVQLVGQQGIGTVINAITGVQGLLPTVSALKAGNQVALANKETLVAGGKLVMALAQEKNLPVLPIDSEHSAIFQCLQGNNKQQVERLIITASGGPFFGWDTQQLKNVTPSQALNHPNWAMGPKITVDSSTLANKALEFIEAMWLFQMPPEKIQVVVHRQSIIHSMVEYGDGSVMAQMGAPDMRIPIQYALTYPQRLPSPAKRLDLLSCPPLTFSQPDTKTFTCLKSGIWAAKQGGLYPCIFNGANEQAVELFLEGKIPYLSISQAVERALEHFAFEEYTSVEQVLEKDKEARAFVRQWLGQ